ncbi:uncharacterized protein LOC126901756 [Daktulosphaira vitifoliae]|uniref:uncharacterized protein LOC126901756 n=1 Tax=Daktulosphaira vitifoliae TaxID=58002 RepID=UPI0021AA1D4F|nr:uncharacterized protein LOC126901756 [Daktulosphaira vitifoliae]
MKEEKIFNDYSNLSNKERTYKVDAQYDGEVWYRKQIMQKIFKNYLSYKIYMSSSLMCQNNENKLCDIIALLTSTHISVKIFEFQPSCNNNGLCNISRYNMQNINPVEKMLIFGFVPTIFEQLEDKTILAHPSSQINPGPYNFII